MRALCEAYLTLGCVTPKNVHDSYFFDFQLSESEIDVKLPLFLMN
jgi:hypothetical protein